MRARTRFTRITAAGFFATSALALSDAHAQSAGTVAKALPNVMLLIDTSGSMERMGDSSLPSQDRQPGTLTPIAAAPYNKCNPGVETNPNRWGMLVQALTGNLQPFYSCGEMTRKSGDALTNEYKINGVLPYDKDYFLPYHRPLAGNGLANACAIGPNKMPGGGGVGPGNLTSAAVGGTTADGFPADALRTLLWNDIQGQYKFNNPIAQTLTCNFDQANDGQLDAARDYIRFAMMTFDNDPDPGVGVTPTTLIPPLSVAGPNPFLGQWSYLRSTPFSYGGLSGKGLPSNCAGPAQDFEVGARNWGAPPWEGRLVPFAPELANLGDIQRTNDQIQQVILATRPYGATPIDAMLDDVRDYLWRNPLGPEQSDDYVKGGCRDEYIILLTDGAPNLNMRTNCDSGGVIPGKCPYPSVAPPSTKSSIAWEIAKDLYTGSAPYHKVPTYVIGFSVNGANLGGGDGFPAGFTASPKNNCSTWFGDPAGFNGNSAAMSTYCNGSPPPTGSTADACCQLNEIAYWGSGGTSPPFFAESQRDLVLAFGRVLANVTKTATTRTVPAYSTTATSTFAGSTRNVAGSFTAAFVPNPRKPWSGQIDRDRQVCVNGLPVAQPFNPALGDAFDQDLAAQAVSHQRRFITVAGDNTSGAAIDSFRTMRPFLPATVDGPIPYQGTEISAVDMALAPATLTPQALGITNTTCKRSRDLTGVTVPALNASDCSQVIWGFATATSLPLNFGGYPQFNVRCSSVAGNKCAVNSALGCAVDTDCSSVTPGDVCVPQCAALGAIFRSSPTVVAPPDALSRDEGYRAFATARKGRPPALFVGTTDGVLHAFKALQEAPTGAKHELWSFVPPAALPRLASNYPTGQQVILDGSPIVKDTVWDRSRANLFSATAAKQWHTTLVAGLGTNGPGYFALNVSDVDCSSNDCQTQYEQPARGNPNEAAFSDAYNGGVKRGPHFLWQLTDIQKGVGVERLPITRSSVADAKDFVPLFGQQTGTPAITTLFFDPDGTGPREIGVAILPGGMNGPPVQGLTCPRALNSTYPPATFPDLSDGAYPRRAAVKRWIDACPSAPNPCDCPVPGRSVTIVRLDTGEIIQHFARITDAPSALPVGKVNDSPFDSPMIGLPIPYPSDVGTIAQKIFIGDADGTMWRIDVSATSPAQWKARLYQDLFTGGTALEGQPIVVPPVASLDPIGNVVIDVATGDQENLIATTDYNKVFSILEGKPSLALANNVQAQVKWYKKLVNGERVTGPMAVFDGTLYFATYVPEPLVNVCGPGSQQYVYGLDYVQPYDPADLKQGGRWKWGLAAPFTDKANFTQPPKGALIPGVAVRGTLNCVDTSGAGVTDYFGATQYGVNSQTGLTYSLDINVAAPGVGRGITKISQALPKPRTPTIIDSWALVVD